MQEADPVPTLHALSDELVGSVRAIVDAEIAGQGESVLPALGRRDRQSQWRRSFVAAAAAFAITVAVIGVVGLLRTNETAVGNAATTVPPPTVTAVAPETTLPATTLPAVPPPPQSSTTTTIPPKPASLEISWQRVPEQAALEDGWIAAVAPGGPGYVAVGGTVGCTVLPGCLDDAAVWISADGLIWERVESPSLRGDVTQQVLSGERVDGGQYMNDIAAGPSGFVAVGAAPVVDADPASGYIDRPGIWLSPDGREWELLPHDEEVLARVDELRRVLVFEDRFVAFGGTLAFASTDGVEWERAAVGGVILDATVWNDLLVAVGESGGLPAVWISQDGMEWARVDDADLTTASGRLQGVGGNAAGLVALGTNSIGRVTAWHSENGSDWAIAPEYVGNDVEWDYQARTALAIGPGIGGIEDDVILINGMATLWGTADGGDLWYSAGEFEGGQLEVLAGPSFAVFNTINEVVVADDQLFAFGKVVAWSGTEPIGGLCYIDPGDGSMGSCRADAAIWVGTWENP
jgi:hypothetical protein